MKKITQKLILLFLLISISGFSQNLSKKADQPIIRCGADEYNKALRQQYPNMMGSQEYENWIKPKIEAYKTLRATRPGDTDVVLTIPVVVHVFHNGEAVGTGPNITDAQVESQITVMNQDFRRMLGTPGYNTHPDGADVEVEFCLAQQDPNGNPTNGIDRINIGQNGITETSLSDAQNQMDALKPTTFWDASKYMNMWSVAFNGGSGLLGYAQFPGGPANTDGVVSDYRFFGSSDLDDGSFILTAPFDKGRTMTHEVGHFLGLFHTWGDNWSNGDPDNASCGFDDQVADTPDSGRPNYGCPSVIPDTCLFGDDDMIENYMDYSDDACMNVFTAGQKARVVATLTSATNRMELTSSIGCTSSTVPLINFGSVSPGQTMEGSDCSFQDINIDLTISLGASASATATLTNSGTATENSDFELINNSVTFNSGSTTASNSITLRVYEDGFDEADETISLSVNVTTSGDAVGVSSNYNLSVMNDDSTITETTAITHFFDNFNDEDISDWTITDSDGDGNNWGDSFVINDSGGSPVTPISIISRSWLTDPLFPDNWVVTPAIDLSSASGTVTLSWITQVAAASWDEEKYSVHVGTTNNIATLVNSATSMTEVLGDVGDTGTPVSHTFDISALAGQATVYIAFRHWDCTDEDFLSVDDVTVSSGGQTQIQTVVNTSSPDMFNLIESGTVFSTDPTSGNLVLDIDNTGGFDYDCTTVSVSRDAATAGADAVMYNSPTVSDYVFAKTFDISTANANTSDNSTINFYFTETEVSAWETITSNSRSSIYVKKEGTNELVAATVSVFGTEVKISAPFTTGLTGTYVFGVQNSLSVNDFELNNVLTIYPNPVNDRLTIKLTNNNLPDGYKIYNMLGQIITENTVSNESDLEINASALSNGMYFIKVSKDNSVVTLPFIKN